MRKIRFLGMALIRNGKRRGEWVELVFAVRATGLGLALGRRARRDHHNVDTYEVATLVVDLFDSKMKHLLWRGSSSATLSSKPDKNTKELDKGVQKMFEHFPPGEKK